MGASLPKLNVFSSLKSSNDLNKGDGQSRKRKKDDTNNDAEDEERQPINPRKKHRCTSDYIYSKLFLSGEGSDVTLTALGSSWNLHKVYLCQSPYFQSMLTGNWIECNQSEIKLIIPDDTIDKTALDIAFGSLYSDYVDEETLLAHIGPVTAAASMLQLDGLLTQCKEVMLDKISSDDVFRFYKIACNYSMKELQKKCFAWLETNLLRQRTDSIFKIEQGLLEQLLVSPHLFVLQVELDAYNFVKVWVYLQLYPKRLHTRKKITESEKFYRKRSSDGKRATPFLQTEKGLRFASVFNCLRLKDLFRENKSLEIIYKDNILPREWTLVAFQDLWLGLLSMASGGMAACMTDYMINHFDESCTRVGRILPKPASYNWRWTGISFGVDIVVMYNHTKRLLTVKRNVSTVPCDSLMCMAYSVSVGFRIKMFTLTRSGMIDKFKDSGVRDETQMCHDEEFRCITIDDDWTFPIYVTGRFQYN